MTDAEELALLVADLRVLADDVVARGATVEERVSRAPASVHGAAPAPVATPKAAVKAVPSQAWATIAAGARDLPAASPREDLPTVRADLGDCRRCGLCSDRTNLVFGVGDAAADLVIVGEGPGFEEDLKGEPFVGPAGQMLDKMLENVLGLPRARVYICNVVKCRPPNNRNPLPDEIAACRPFLERQILAVAPKVILALGNVPMKTLLGTEVGITKVRGTWHEWRGIPLLPTFHPAYLLRNPSEKRKVFEDLKVLNIRYDELGGRR